MTTEALQFRVHDQSTGQVHMNLNEPQSRVIVSKKEIIIMQAGTGSGKTSVLAIWLDLEMQDKGPGDYLVASPTFPLMEARVIPELMELFVHLDHRFIYRPGFRRFESVEQVNNRPAYRIFLGSAVNPDSLESATYKGVAIDELAQSQFPRGAWEAIQRRVNFNRGRILGTTTLYDVSGWYKSEIYDRWKDGDERFDIIQADSIANPAFPRERYEAARISLPWWKFNMFYRGIYERPAGLIYDGFSEEDQIIPRFSLDPAWPRYCGHDFGPQNTAAIWVAVDPGTGHCYLYRSYWAGNRTVGQHAEEFKRLSEGEEIRSRSGGSHQEEEIRYAYTAAGWPIREPLIQHVEAGIDRAYSFVKTHLFVFADQHDFLNELLTYSRELDDSYEPTDKIDNKSKFHMMDCMRYLFSNFAPERTTYKKEATMKVRKAASGAPKVERTPEGEYIMTRS